MEFIEKVAVLHVHTDASDGTASAEEVIRVAEGHSVDILGINDHGNLRVREEGLGGWNRRLFVLAGAELEDPGENSHLIVYGVDSLPETEDTGEQIAAVNSAGGLAIIAHPCERSGHLPGTRAYPWTARGTEGAAGVEIWNYMSAWKAGLSLFNLPMRLARPDRVVEHPDAGAIELWTSIGGCAVGGPDAHAFRYGAGPLGVIVFPYRMLFGRLRTHILLESELPEESVSAERLVLEALRRGSCYVSNRLLGDARGFRWKRCGEVLELNLPGPGSLVLNGGGFRKGPVPGLAPGIHKIDWPYQGPLVISVLREGRTWICCCVR